MKTQLQKFFLVTFIILNVAVGFAQTPDIKLQAINRNPQPGAVLDLSLLYGQTVYPLSFGVTSQQFPDFPAYSSQAADDFVIPPGDTWSVENIQINGFYSNGGGPVQMANIFFYLNDQQTNSPGNIVVMMPQINVQTDLTGNLLLNFSMNPVMLQSGHYWLSVQPIMAYTNFGQWFWAKQAAPTISEEFNWQNPEGGWNLPNTSTWQKASLIDWGSPSVDWNLSFAIFGTVNNMQIPSIDSINNTNTHLGESVRFYGSGFGTISPTSFLFIDGTITPTTFWSDNEVYFDCPMLDTAYPHSIQISRFDGSFSNQVEFTVYQPTEIFFLSPNDNERITVDSLRIKVALPVFKENISEVRFYYRPVGYALWSYLGSDFDGTDLTYSTNNPIGSGDGWSYCWHFGSLPDMTYTISVNAYDLYGNTYTGFRDVIIDYNSPALRINPDSCKLVAGKTVPDDYFDIKAEVDESEATEITLTIKDWIGFDFTRILKKRSQHDVTVNDKNGKSMSGDICGPTAAAVCLNWLKDPANGNPDADIDDLIRELAEKAKTEKGKGTTDSDLEKAIKEVGKKDPALKDIETEHPTGKDHGYGQVGKNLRDSVDVILLILQKYTDAATGTVQTAGHYVTVSSHHIYHGYEPGPPGSNILCMAIERQYIDFMDPGTGETEYKEVEYWKKPPTLKDYNIVPPPNTSAGDAEIGSTILVKNPKKSRKRAFEVVYTVTIPTNGQGIYHFTVPSSALPASLLHAEISVKNNGTEMARDFVTLTNGDATPFANFSAISTSGPAPFTVQFNDLSLPPDSIESWYWDFGDGEQSLAEEPQHTYQNPGLYNVTLIASDGKTSDTIVKTDYINVTTPECQAISIPDGWSGLSSFIVPSNPNIPAMFDPIIDNLILLYNFNTIFYPAGGVLPDKPWNSQSGYVVKMSQTASLSVCGTVISSPVVSLNFGWNIMPVLSPDNVDVALTFGSIGAVKFAKDIAGVGVYWKIYGINSLHWMLPGRAYFVYSTENVDVLLKGRTPGMKSIPVEEPSIATPWNKIVKTAESHVIVFPQALGTGIKSGEIIGAFDASGSCCGVTEYSGNGSSLVIFGDDPYTLNPDGFETNESFTFRMFCAKTNEYFDLNITFDSSAPSQGYFEPNGLSVVKSAEILMVNSAIDNFFISFEIFPNPTKGRIVVKTNASDAHLEIVNLTGELVFSAKLIGTEIDISGLKSGIYFARLRNTKDSVIRKLIVE